jgi:D-threo-aldose 1-dehydrogenase
MRMPEPEPPLGPLAFGGASVANKGVALSDDEAFEVLEAAWAGGIRYFDTAPHYGLGLSERRIGAFLRTKPREEFLLSTKVGRLLVPDGERGGDDAGRLDGEGFLVPATARRVWDFSADGVRRSLDESLERLGLDRVDIAYLHDPERSDVGATRALESGVPALAALRDEGVVSRIGIGSMVTESIVAAARTGALDLAMIAGRLTLVDQSALTAAVPACRENGVEIVAAAVFNSGVLATPEPVDSASFDYTDAPPDVLARVRRIAGVCRRHGVDVPTAALQFPLRAGAGVGAGAVAVVVGSDTPAQLAENLARLGTRVPDELWSELAAEGLIEGRATA